MSHHDIDSINFPAVKSTIKLQLHPYYYLNYYNLPSGNGMYTCTGNRRFIAGSRSQGQFVAPMIYTIGPSLQLKPALVNKININQ